MEATGQNPCPACGGKRVDRTIRVPDHEYGVVFVASYARCQDCASEYQVPMPDGTTLATFYPADYHSMQADGFLVRLRNRMRWKRLSSLLRGNAALLDYGCGEGQFLHYAATQDSRRDFVGYEIASEREIRRSEDGRVTIVRGAVDDLLELLPRCSLITMNHVIEHLPDPRLTLTGLADKLEPGGILEGQTPAAGCLEERVFGTRWSGYHAPRHTVVFSPDGLQTLLTNSGFGDTDIRGTFNPAGLALSLASLRHGPTGGSLQRSGPAWLVGLGLATGLSLVDRLSGAPAVVDFAARRA